MANEMDTVTLSNDVGIDELDNVTEIGDTALIILEDEQNTKTMTISAFRKNLISDDDAPSDSKIYSSKKMEEKIQTHEETMNKSLASSNYEIQYIKENYAKTQFVNDQVNKINENMFTKEDKDNIEQALQTKRDKNIPITCNDLDTSSDVSKIKLDNLSEEVLSAMTGETPVALVKAPQGGWTTESYANKSITAEKLSSSYRFRGQIVTGSINDLIDDGVYLLGPNVDGIPKLDDEDKELKILYVTLYGQSREFIEQKVDYVYQLESRPYYVRKGRTLNIHNLKFNPIYTISGDFKVGVSLFGEEIFNRGSITEGNLFEYTSEGTYKVSPGVSNLPSDDEYFVTIKKHDDYYVYEAKLHSDYSCIVYVCYVHQNEYGIIMATKWFKITDINKSKFDNQRIHLFGDGICFGLGSTDISRKAYPYLLYDKYGFRVFNHAVNDATVGNYGVSTLADKSVLNQITNTSFEDGDIAIIFAGTNDFRIGSCPIGNNTDKKDTTFKGSLNLAIEKILTMNQSVKILLVTPMYRARIDSGDNRDSDSTPVNNRYLSAYVSAINEIASLNHIPVLDMMNEGMINKYNHTRWLEDGLYFNDNGHQLFATKLFDKLSSLY